MENVIINCDLLFEEENFFNGSIERTVPDDSKLRKHIDENKVIKLFEKYKQVLYFMVFSFFVFFSSYQLADDIHFNTYAIILLVVFTLLALCFAGSVFLLMNYKKILRKLVDEINDLKIGNENN